MNCKLTFSGKDNIRNFPSKLTNVFNNEEEISTLLFQELLWIEARDMWYEIYINYFLFIRLKN